MTGPGRAGGYIAPTRTDVRLIVALAAMHGVPVGINVRGRIHVVRSVDEYDEMVGGAA